MNITERDIFIFVTNKEELSEEKRNAITSNPAFADMISIIKSSLDEGYEVSEDAKRKLAEKISLYAQPKVIELYPETLVFNNADEASFLFAAKSNIANVVATKVFEDTAKKIAVRIHNFKAASKVFVQNDSEKTLDNFFVTFSPNNEKLFFKSSAEHAEWQAPINAAKAVISFSD